MIVGPAPRPRALLLVLCLALSLLVPGAASAVVAPDTIGLFRGNAPSGSNTFFLRNHNTLAAPANTIAGVGATGDQPLVGDWDGDGIVTFGLVRSNVPAGSNTVFLWNTNALGPPDVVIEGIGAVGDIFLVGDWDGNGTDTLAIMRPNSPAGSNTIVYWNNLNNPPPAPNGSISTIGAAGDLPIIGKWNGTGASSIALLRPSSPAGSNTFFIWLTLPGTTPAAPDVTIVGIGAAGDLPLGGDWDGTGTDTIGLFRANQPAGMTTFFLWNSVNLSPPLPAPDVTVAGYGASTDLPVVGHWGNNPPVVDPATFSVPALSANGTNVGTVTFTDPDSGQTHTFAIESGNTNTAFAINAGTGQITVNNSAALDGTTPSFNLTVRVTDNGTPVFFGEAVITVNLTPTAHDDSYTTLLNTPLAQPAPGVLANDTLAGAAIFSYGATTGAEQTTIGAATPTSAAGSVTLNADGSFNYTPATGFNGNDTFKYVIKNSAGSSTATVTVQVQQAPLITSANSYTKQIKTTLTFSVTTTGTPAPTVSQAPVGAQTGFPAGVTFTPSAGSAAIGGSVTSGGAQTYTTTITAANGVGSNDTQSFSLIITCPTITLGPANNSIFAATYNVLFTQGFTPSGGTTPYTYTLGGAALPSVGFSGDNLTGTPNNTGGFVFTVKATDATGCSSAVQNYTLNVNPVANTDSYGTVLGNVFVDSSTVPFSVLTNDSFPSGTGSVTGFDASSNLGGTVSVAANGQFTYDPPRGTTGADFFHYTLSSHGQTAQGTVNITVSNKIWFIDGSSPCSSSCDGRQSHPYTLLSAFTTANTGAVPAPQDGDPIFIYTGSGYLGPLTLRTNQKVLGQGASVSLAAFTGLTAGSGQSLPTTGGTFPSITTSAASTNAVNVASGNTLRGFNVGNTTGSKISGSAIGTLTTSEITLSGSGQALNLTTSGTVSGSLAGTSSTSGSENVVLSGIGTSGTYDLGSGALSGATSDALVISGGSGSFTYSGTISNGNTLAVNINNKTGGTVTLSGDINPAAAAKGISVASNSGGTVNFSGANKKISTGTGTGVNLATNTVTTIAFSNGGLAITTTSGVGFSATGGGTVNVSGSGNTINSTSATALNVTSTTIGSSGLTFQSISSGNNNANPDPTKGIVLNNTGASFGLTVTGTGTTDASGGTIQRTTSNGAEFISSNHISLSNMDFTNNGTAQTVPGSDTSCGGNLITGNNLSCVSNVHLQTVNTASLTNVNVTNGGQMGINGNDVTTFSLTNSTITGNGDESLENGITFQNLKGTSAITDTTVKDNAARQIYVENSTGTVTLTVSKTSGTMIIGHTNRASALPSQQGILFSGNTAATMTLNVDGVTVQNNFGNGIQSNIQGASSLNGFIQNSSFNVNAAGINLQTNNSSTLGASGSPFIIQNNPVNIGNQLQGINIGTAAGSTGSVFVKIDNNTIGTSGTAGSACDLGFPGTAQENCAGITLTKFGTNAYAATVTNNHLFNVGQNGIAVTSDLSGSVNVKIGSNTIHQPYNSVATTHASGNAIQTNLGTTNGTGQTACVDIISNDIDGAENPAQPGGPFGWDPNNHGAFFIRSRNSTVTDLANYAGGNSQTNVRTFLAGQNTNTNQGVQTFDNTDIDNATGSFANGPAACAVP